MIPTIRTRITKPRTITHHQGKQGGGGSVGGVVGALHGSSEPSGHLQGFLVPSGQSWRGSSSASTVTLTLTLPSLGTRTLNQFGALAIGSRTAPAAPTSSSAKPKNSPSWFRYRPKGTI